MSTKTYSYIADPKWNSTLERHLALILDASFVTASPVGKDGTRVNDSVRLIQGNWDDLVDKLAAAIREDKELVNLLSDALRYIEVNVAYQGAMTAAQVEEEIKRETFPSRVSIGANSSNTLASFDIAKARAALKKAKGE